MSPGRRLARRVGILATLLLASLAVLLIVAAVAFYQLSQVPSPTALPQAQTYTITYADGSPMYSGGSVSRTDVPLNKVPPHVRDAVLAAEDRGFYSEHGLSIRGTARAALNDLRGGSSQGGSGITQQYVKNHYLSSSHTLSRKFKELAIAVKLDRDYRKDQILDWYLNSIYWGRDNYGIQAASQSYFHQDVSRLTVSEGAVLAGIIQSPNDDDPATAPQLAKDRWNYVLDGMVSTKKLDPAVRAKMVFPKAFAETSGQQSVTGPTQLVVAQVKAELGADGISPATLNTAGLKIQTTIDKSAQTDAVDAIKKAYANVSAENNGRLKEALVAVDPSTGGVVAYYGGRNDKISQLDYAQSYRMAGSAFKPYVLATALQNTVDGGKPAYTVKSIFDAGPYKAGPTVTLKNDPTDPQSGSYTLAQSMTKSLNTVYARLAVKEGPAKVADTAHAMGIRATTQPNGKGADTLRLDGQTDFRIGIGGYEVRPLDQAVGMATLANGGTERTGYFISKVTDAKGHVLFQHKDTGKRVIDAKVANDTTLAMEKVASNSGFALQGGRPNAAKTGTVGIGSSDKNSDAWTVGFTPQVSVASWVGSNTLAPIYNDQGRAMYGKTNAGHAWKYFVDAYLDGKPKADMPTEQQVRGGTNEANTSTSQATNSPTPSASPSTSANSSTSASTSSAPTTSTASTPSDTPPPTDTPTSSDTPTPTNTPTSTTVTPTRSPVTSPRPTATRTSTAQKSPPKTAGGGSSATP